MALRGLLIEGLVSSDFAQELHDPRGGRVLDASSDLLFNNLHVPYRGRATDFMAPAIDPQGRPTSYLQTFPGVDSQLASASLERVLAGLRAKEAGLGGYNGQIFYTGLHAEVTI
jgi:hypothetical protein